MDFRLEAVNRKLGVSRVIDLSATPFFLRGRELSEVQRTCHELVGPIRPTRMTHMCHSSVVFAVMHNGVLTPMW